METSATILADSINTKGVRITTLELQYHRYVLAEFNTHRAFSRNGASSRAIPTKTLIARCLEEEVEPLEWGLDQSGMQAFTHADAALTEKGRAIWNRARRDAIGHAEDLMELGFAKQIVNRVIEPYLPTRTVVTATDWANWDTLRHHADAAPEIRELARCIIEARKDSKPRMVGTGEWHLPYILPEDYERMHHWLGEREFIDEIKGHLTAPEIWFENDLDIVRCMVSAARCARVSYRTVEGKPTDFLKDLELFKRLVVSQPVHASPTEHQATPYAMERGFMTANFRHFVPFRRLISGETVHD